jgi:anti-anti-sigma factor
MQVSRLPRDDPSANTSVIDTVTYQRRADVVTSTLDGAIVTYQPHGNIDRATARAFQANVCAAIDATAVTVVVDFADVDFIDRAAFRALEKCGSYALYRGRALVVSSLPAPYARLRQLFRWTSWS